MKNIYSSVEEYEKNCYLFAPSVSKRKTVGGKSYYVSMPRNTALKSTAASGSANMVGA